MSLSLSEISTVAASFHDDLRAYAAAGFDGIGIWEMKLGDDESDLEALRASGLRVTNCVPAVPSILPNTVIEGPEDVGERVDALCASLHRLARYEPECVLCLTGPAGGRGESEARGLVVDGLRRIAAAADSAGVPLGLEPIHVSQRDDLTLIATIPETLALLDEVGRPSLGIMFDTYHLWDTPTLDEDIAAHVDRFTGVHVADYREPPRSSSDRVLPGDGVADLPRLLAALDTAGWDGFYDVEIFSDELWKLEPDEFARRAVAALERVSA